LSKYGRKLITQVGTLGSIITNICIALGFLIIKHQNGFGTTLILLGLILFMFNYGVTLGPIVFVIIP